MKIVLVKPPLSLAALYKGLAGAGSELPPLGLATLAAVARENAHDVAIIDAEALKLPIEKIKKRIIDIRPDVIGITAVTPEIATAAKIAENLKAAGLDAPIILGGPHVTAVPEETLNRYPAFDLAAVGEAEVTFVEWLDGLQDGRNPEETPGLLLRNTGPLTKTAPRPFIDDLDRIPFPAWDLLPPLARTYHPAADTLHRFPASLMVTSRGCPFKCVFCDRSVFGNRVRGFSAGYVLEMMRILRNQHGIRDVFIEDDNFLVLKRRTKEICETLQQERLDLTWSCLGRVDVVTPEYLRLIKSAGCWQVNYGCESGEQEILDIIGKGTRVEQIEQAVRWTREAGLDAKGLFMAGNFGETKETIEKTLSFIRRLPLTDFHMTSFTPLPGSEAYDVADRWGEFDPSWEKMSLFSAEVFTPKGLTREDVRQFMRSAYKNFYLRPDTLVRYAHKLLRPRLYPKLFRGLLGFLKFVSSR
ncbi:MAG: radical SAM protein [bacterium]